MKNTPHFHSHAHARTHKYAHFGGAAYNDLDHTETYPHFVRTRKQTMCVCVRVLLHILVMILLYNIIIRWQMVQSVLAVLVHPVQCARDLHECLPDYGFQRKRIYIYECFVFRGL